MKKILYVINVDWFFVSHFLQLAIESKNRGYEVHIACTTTDKEEYLKSLGFEVHQLNMSRSSIGIIQQLQSIKRIYDVLVSVNADVVQFFTIKPIIFGGLASKLLCIPNKIFYVTGLGYVFIANGLKGKIIKFFARLLYKIALNGDNTKVITENPYDKELILGLGGIKDDDIVIIKGAGVNLSQYSYKEEPTGKVVVSMASRLLKDKGVYEYVEACKLLSSEGVEAVYELYGDIDPDNPSSLTQSDLDTIKQDGVVEVRGFSKDIASIFASSNLVVLPSYREGFPKVLIEASACGRAVVTSDVAGCKDAIIVNETGLLCEVKNPYSLAQQMKILIQDTALRNKMGKAGRKLAEEEYEINKIVQQHFELYEKK